MLVQSYSETTQETKRQGSVNLFHLLLSHTLLYLLILHLFFKMTWNFSCVSVNSFIISSRLPRLQKRKNTLTAESLFIELPDYSKQFFWSFWTNIWGNLHLIFRSSRIFDPKFVPLGGFKNHDFHCVKLFITWICSMVPSVISTDKLWRTKNDEKSYNPLSSDIRIKILYTYLLSLTYNSL